ncbi:hypothetical protein ACWDOP_20845 [Nocardia sp. NPDC003693]
MPGRGSAPDPDANRFDAVERLRRKLERLEAAKTGPAEPEPPAADDDGAAAKLTRLPRRPRRMTEEPAQPPRQPWRPDGVPLYDPAPTRPVTRSELQRETGWWPAASPPPGFPAPEAPGAPAGSAADQDAGVVDLTAFRRKRSGEDATSFGGIRRMAKPRRISPATEPEAGRERKPGEQD